MRMIRRRIPKPLRGGVEGGFVTPAALILTDAVVTWCPWFLERRESLAVLLGMTIGAVVRELTARFLWRSYGR